MNNTPLQLFAFQKEFLKDLKEKIHVTIPTGMGKSYVILQYAIDNPNSLVVIHVAPSLAAQYLRLIKTYNITNVKLVS